MSDIDPEKLEEALAYIGETGSDMFQTVVAAARAHLSTLPRWKEVEIEQWAVVDPNGKVVRVCSAAKMADDLASIPPLTIVRLSGTAKVKVTP